MVEQGKTVREAIRQLGVTEQTYYRWRKEYGGMDTTQARLLRDREREHTRLKRIVADQALDISNLREVGRGHLSARHVAAPRWPRCA